MRADLLIRVPSVGFTWIAAIWKAIAMLPTPSVSVTMKYAVNCRLYRKIPFKPIEGIAQVESMSLYKGLSHLILRVHCGVMSFDDCKGPAECLYHRWQKNGTVNGKNYPTKLSIAFLSTKSLCCL